MLLLTEEVAAAEDEEGHTDPTKKKILDWIQENFGGDNGTMDEY